MNIITFLSEIVPNPGQHNMICCVVKDKFLEDLA